MIDAARILVVEDETTIRHILRDILEEGGYEVRDAGSAEEGLVLLGEKQPCVALLDIVLPGMNGLKLLSEIKRISPDTEVVLMTSHASVETAVEAIRQGAYHYLQKPFESLDEVMLIVEKAVEKRNLALRNRALLEEQARKNQELSSAVLRLSSLIDAGRAMGEFRALPELLDFFIGLVARELQVDRASLMLLDTHGQQLQIAACRGFEDREIKRVRVPVGEGVAGSVARSGKPFLVTDARTDPRFKKNNDPSLSESFISAPIVLSIPIKCREKVLGVINVTNRRTGRPFDESDLSYLSGLSGQLAVAIEGAKHFENLQRAYDSLKATQDQLVFSERNKAIGQMAAGVAHDFNNALSVILGRTQFGLRKLEQDGEGLDALRNDLGAIKKVALQAAETIKRVQDYTRIRKDVPDAAVDINSVVREAVEMNRPKWKDQCEVEGREVDVRFELGSIPAVSGNVHELTQVVGNLIFNAVEAMPGGGKLSFRSFCDDEWVVLEVADTGSGMSPETQKHLFEPFFTTKETGQGLGTSIIYGIIARHRGEITVRSTEGEGTTFRVRLPAVQSTTRVEDSCGTARNADFQPARVLLVEDDVGVRETYIDVLASFGHEVVAASTGNEALKRFRSQDFDLVITDLSMPGISGLELAKCVKRVDPTMPVVLISGWAVQQKGEALKEAGVDHVLDKPCLNEVLLDMVQKAIRPHREALA